MTILQRYPNQNHATGYDCAHYQSRAGSKRCQHYLDGGACSLASEFMCVEWLKRNGHPVPEHHPTRAMPPAQPALFPTLVPANQDHVPPAPSAPEPAPRPAVAPTVPEAMPAPVPAHPRAPITPGEIDSFKALGVELCIRSEELGEVWLVPGYTGQARKEITPEHAATLRLLLEAFPGGRVTSFGKPLAPARHGMLHGELPICNCGLVSHCQTARIERAASTLLMMTAALDTEPSRPRAAPARREPFLTAPAVCRCLVGGGAPRAQSPPHPDVRGTPRTTSGRVAAWLDGQQ